MIDLLIDGLRKLDTDQEMQEYVEAAIAKENALLTEVNSALTRQVQLARRDATQLEANLQSEQEERNRAEAAAQTLIQLKEQEKVSAIQTLQQDQQLAINQAAQQVAVEQAARLHMERRLQVYGVLTAVVCSILFFAGSEWFIHFLPWTWLLDHQRSSMLRITGYITILLGVIGLLVPATRKVVWGGGIIAALIAVLLGAL